MGDKKTKLNASKPFKRVSTNTFINNKCIAKDDGIVNISTVKYFVHHLVHSSQSITWFSCCKLATTIYDMML